MLDGVLGLSSRGRRFAITSPYCVEGNFKLPASARYDRRATTTVLT